MLVEPILIYILDDVYKFPIFVLFLLFQFGLSYDHDDVIEWKHFPHCWPFVRGIKWSPVNSPHKGHWRGPLMFFFYLRMNKRLSKHSWGWWLETPSRSLWHHYNDDIFFEVSLFKSCFWRQWLKNRYIVVKNLSRDVQFIYTSDDKNIMRHVHSIVTKNRRLR